MSTSNVVIDFRELVSLVEGEGLEQLARLLGEELGLQPDPSGRGHDGGRDMFFTSHFDNPLKIHIRWLVSCKDLALSGRSVNEADIPSPETKMRQHGARGYLLVTTTTISTGAKAMLDGLVQSGEWFTDVWDNARLTQWLLKPGNDALLRQFFPNSHATLKARDVSGSDDIGLVSERYAQATRRNSRPLLIAGIAAPLQRNEVPHVEDALEEGKPVLVSGDSGTGKSGIAHALCSPRSQPDKSVLLLDARRYANIQNIANLPDHIGLSEPILSGLERLGRRTGCRLIIDQLDSAANTAAGIAFTELAIQCAETPGVEVVVLSRRRENSETKLLSQLTKQGFVELECGALPEEAVRSALFQIDLIAPSEDLVQLSKNLLNMSLVAQIKMEQPGFDFNSVLDEVALWGRIH